MTEVIQSIGSFILVVLSAMFVENAVFTRGFGVSRLVKLVSDSKVDSIIFCVLLCVVQLVSSPLAFFANRELVRRGVMNAAYYRPLVFVLCAIVAFGVALALLAVLPTQHRKDMMAVLPMATFNSAVLGPLLISATQNHTLSQTIGFALGSGLGYGFAALVLTEGRRKMAEADIPATFRGLPINLLYIGILALAIFGLTGHRLVY